MKLSYLLQIQQLSYIILVGNCVNYIHSQLFSQLEEEDPIT